MLEAMTLAAKPWYWWRPVDGARAKARETEAGLVGGRHSELLELRPWLGVGKWVLAIGNGAGMPAVSSSGDRGCARVDSPSPRLADKAGGGFARDTGHPLAGR
jgi:hypothetical protein